ncbi:MAG: adenosyl-hopene transferase HpnH [Verrucomicrobiota bacterium]
MAVPISQAWKVATYVMGQKLKGNKRYPLVLMLEPLFRCNLACEGCGKIQFPEHILKKRVSAEKALAAAEECGAPIVSIAGGEPLIHPEIEQIVDGLINQGRYIYLCTNALLLERALKKFKPHKQLTFSVHMDGLKEEHDKSVCRDGTYDIAFKAIKQAVDMGFRVTTNTTLFNNAEPDRVHGLFDELMEVGVESMMLSPGYPYEKAPEQEIFLESDRTKVLFKKILSGAKEGWRFNHSPNFLAFLKGEIDYNCTPWGNPTYNVFGWQKPCYLLADGYTRTFKEMMETTDWPRYGKQGTDERCKDCMVHCGYEASAVDDSFSLGGAIRMMKASSNLRKPITFTEEEEVLYAKMKEEAAAREAGAHACASSSGGASARDDLLEQVAANRMTRRTESEVNVPAEER